MSSERQYHDYPVRVARLNGNVSIYAADNYGDDPEWLSPDEARLVSNALIAAADDAQAWGTISGA